MERMVTIPTDLERILVDQASAMARELEAVTDGAPDGRVLAVAEIAALRSSRELTRRALEAALQRQAEAAEKKGRLAAPAPARSRARRPRRR